MTVLSAYKAWDVNEHTYDEILRELLELGKDQKLTPSIVFGNAKEAQMFLQDQTKFENDLKNNMLSLKRETEHLSAQTHVTTAGPMVNPKVIRTEKANGSGWEYHPNPHFKPNQKNPKQPKIMVHGLLSYYLDPNHNYSIEDVKDTYRYLLNLKAKSFKSSSDFRVLFPGDNLRTALRSVFGIDGTRFGAWMKEKGLLKHRFSLAPRGVLPLTKGKIEKADYEYIFEDYPIIAEGMSQMGSHDQSSYWGAFALFKEVPIGDSKTTIWISAHIQAKMWLGEIEENLFDAQNKHILEAILDKFNFISKKYPEYGDYLSAGGYNAAIKLNCFQSHSKDNNNWYALLNEENSRLHFKTIFKIDGSKPMKNKFHDMFDICGDIVNSELVLVWNDKDMVTHLKMGNKEYILYSNTLKGYPDVIQNVTNLSDMYNGSWNNVGRPLAKIIEGNKEIYGLYNPKDGSIYRCIEIDVNKNLAFPVPNKDTNIITIEPSRDAPYLSPAGHAPAPVGPTQPQLQDEKQVEWDLRKVTAFMGLHSDKNLDAISNPLSLRYTDVHGTSRPIQFIEMATKALNYVKRVNSSKPPEEVAKGILADKSKIDSLKKKELEARKLYQAAFNATIEAKKKWQDAVQQDVPRRIREILETEYNAKRAESNKLKAPYEVIKEELDIITTYLPTLFRRHYFEQFREKTYTPAKTNLPQNHNSLRWPTEQEVDDILAEVRRTQTINTQNEILYHYNPSSYMAGIQLDTLHPLFHAMFSHTITAEAYYKTKLLEAETIKESLAEGDRSKYTADLLVNHYSRAVKAIDEKTYAAIKSYATERLDVSNPNALYSEYLNYEKQQTQMTRVERADIENHATKEKINLNLKFARKQQKIASIIKVIRSFLV